MHDSAWPLLTSALTISRDVVAVVRLNLDRTSDQVESLRGLLSGDELARADRFKFEEPRRRFVVCRATLRQLLGACLGVEAAAIQFTYGPHGKPQLDATSRVGRVVEAHGEHGEHGRKTVVVEDSTHPTERDPSPQFSVSHSADRALIAISSGRHVGVDLECHDAKVRIHKLAERFFSPREFAELESLPTELQLAGFYRGWTSKEAYLKATGFGLSFSLSQFTVAMNPTEPAGLIEVVEQSGRADLANEAARWRMHSLSVAADFSAALLVEATASENVVIRQWELGVCPNRRRSYLL